MFANPAKAKHAAKVALAMVLAYALALQWAWINPAWAGFAITFCSLTTSGESLNKSILRIWGTILGTLIAFVILAFFIQDRWLFLAAICVPLAILTYLMTGSRAQYLWMATGLVALVILSGATGDSNSIFQYGVARMLETLLGCTVWALVDIFLWPVTNKASLEKTAMQLTSVERQLINECRRQCVQEASTDDQAPGFSQLRAKQLGLIAKLDAELHAAGAESYTVRELQKVWQQLLADSRAMLAAIDNWQAGIHELASIDVQQVVPDFDAFMGSTDQFVGATERIWAGKPGSLTGWAQELQADPAALVKLAHFDRAAIAVTLAHLMEIHYLAIRQNHSVAVLRNTAINSGGSEQQLFGQPDLRADKQPFVFDLDRLRGAGYIVALICVNYFLWIYVDPPGHQSLWSMGVIIGLVAVQAPHIRIGPALLKAVLIYMPVAALIYILVMPALSGYTELGIVIFAYVFWAQYGLTNPMAILAAMLGFMNMMLISNAQTYSFVSVAIGYLFLIICLMLVIGGSYLLGSPRPEKMFMGLVRRYFHSASFILRFMANAGQMRPGPLTRYRMAFHRREITTLPEKMGRWSSQISRQDFPGNSPEQVKMLVSSLGGLSYRLQELLELKNLPQATSLVKELSTQVHEWRQVMQHGFVLVARGEAPGSAERLVANLTDRLAGIEHSLDAVMVSTADDQLGDDEFENAYRLLGAYRGVANAAIAWLSVAEQVDWAQWHEECFS